MIKHVAILVTVLLLSTPAFTQQDPVYAQYNSAPLLQNPAFAGFFRSVNAAVGYRNQWSGIDGPRTFNFAGDLSLRNNRIGAGITVLSDRIGVQKRSDFMGAFAYHMPVNPKTTLSFGMQAGVIQYKTNDAALNVYDPNDPMFQGGENFLIVNAGAGLILSSDKFYAALSVPRFLDAVSDLEMGEQTMLSRHYYLSGAYMFLLSETVFLKPSVMLRYVPGAPVSADMNASVILNQNYSAGLFTRNFNTYGILLQMIMKEEYRLGYVFEMPTGKAVPSQFVTHEITLGLRMAAFGGHERPSGIRLF